MTAAERSFLGLAKQTSKGTPNTTDANFDYILFRNGGVAPNTLFLPLDQEIGGGAMLRDVIKAGVTSAGTIDFIPRPQTIGHFLLGAIGNVAAPSDNLDGSYDHVFTLPADEFDAPYFTVRAAPGNMWGEQLQDCRVAGLVFTFTGARFVEAAVTLMGGEPKPVSTAGWSPATYLDAGPQFISPLGDIEIPTSTDVKVLSGSIAMGLQIPLDEQWIVGSYFPDDFDINQRTAVITLNIKVTDDVLYEKMMYDPAAGGTWLADVYKEGDIKLYLQSPEDAGSTPTPYSIDFSFDTSDDNIIWTVNPIALRAGRQVVMQVTGTVINSANEPITVTLQNQESAQY
jgi:hypothetical protein